MNGNDFGGQIYVWRDGRRLHFHSPLSEEHRLGWLPLWGWFYKVRTLERVQSYELTVADMGKRSSSGGETDGVRSYCPVDRARECRKADCNELIAKAELVRPIGVRPGINRRSLNQKDPTEKPMSAASTRIAIVDGEKVRG